MNTIDHLQEIMMPNIINLAELDYPKPVLKAITAYNKAFEVFAEAETEYLEARQNYREAQLKDAQALKQAVKDGQPDPGEPNLYAAMRSVKYMHEKTMQARLAANSAARELRSQLKANADVIALAAAAKAETGMDEFHESINRLQAELSDTLQRRYQALDGLRMVAHERLQTGFSFDPNYPLPGEMRIAYVKDNRVEDHVALIRKHTLESIEASLKGTDALETADASRA